MKLISYTQNGSARSGALVDDAIVEFDKVGLGSDDLGSTLATVGLPWIMDRAAASDATLALADVELLPPIPAPSKIICAGVNYRAHRDEASHDDRAHPVLFTRFADTQIADGVAARKPAFSSSFDYEGELAVVIGEPAWQMQRKDALGVIAGYSIYNDFSVRDWQRHTGQWLPGKNFPATGAFGPALVTGDEIDDLASLTLTTRVNGDVRQQAKVEDLIFDVPALIEYITTFTPLGPGDVIVTGTPGGVGLFMEPPTFLQAGDKVEVEITDLGVLCNEVVEDPPTNAA